MQLTTNHHVEAINALAVKNGERTKMKKNAKCIIREPQSDVVNEKLRWTLQNYRKGVQSELQKNGNVARD